MEDELSLDLDQDRRVLLMAEVEVWTYYATCQTAARLVIDGVADSNSLTSQEVKYQDHGNARELLVTSAMVDLVEGEHGVELELYDGCGWNKGTRLHALELQPVVIE